MTRSRYTGVGAFAGVLAAIICQSALAQSDASSPSGGQSAAVLRLEIKGGMTLLDTSYSVFEAGRVLREERVVGSGKLWSQQVAYVSPEEVQNWTRLLFEARVMTPDPEEFRRHFPNGAPNVTDSAMYVLSVRDPISGQASGEQRRAMLNPSYLAELAPAYDPARAMDDLHRLLDSLFE